MNLHSALTLILAFFRGSQADPWVKLTSDGPVVLDATISFRAELKDFEGYDPPFYFSWRDDASPTHWYETETESSVSDWNITYASKNKYEEREYHTTVRVYYDNIFDMRDKIAENAVAYKVTKNLNGKLVFKQNGRRNGSDVIKSTQDTELSIQFHDPSRKFYFFKENLKLSKKIVKLKGYLHCLVRM